MKEVKARKRNQAPRQLAAAVPASREEHWIAVFHQVVVAGAIATVVLTWPMWQVRSAPPMIALLPLPSIPVGVPLLAALALAAWRPGPGLAAYAVVLGYAITTDWTRLQPALVSFALLMTARLPTRGGRAVARAHVLSLWFYAGFHKLLSPEFMADRNNPRMLQGLLAEPPPWVRAIYPEAVVCGEIGLAVLAALPATRRIAAVGACLLHAGILLSIIPTGLNWNDSVWAWNVVLGLAGFFLIAPWKESIADSFRSQRPLVKGVIVFLALYPAASQLGIGDPYLAHHLYSRSTPISYVCRIAEPPPSRPGLGDFFATPDGEHQCRFVDFVPWLDQPEPGEHAFVRAYFTRTCIAGDVLFIRERRRFFLARGAQWAQLPCSR